MDDLDACVAVHADEFLAELTLPAKPASLRAARVFVATHLAAAGLSVAEERAVLLVGEVVSNAFSHAGSPIRLRLRRQGASVRIEVFDDNSHYPTLRMVPATAVTGRGLVLVPSLADQWGVDLAQPGRVIWFTVRTDLVPPASETQRRPPAVRRGRLCKSP